MKNIKGIKVLHEKIYFSLGKDSNLKNDKWQEKNLTILIITSHLNELNNVINRQRSLDWMSKQYNI